jgi:hypothetical protein
MTDKEANALAVLKDEVRFAVRAMIKYPKLVQRAHKLEGALVDFNDAVKEADSDEE